MCCEYFGQVNDELQETNQHLRHRSADLALENST